MSQTEILPKTRHDENFPVGSWLIAPDLRPTVHAYYRFARLADDIADSPDLSAEEKLTRLGAMERALLESDARAESPDGTSAAITLRDQMNARELPLTLASNLLAAFKRDAVNDRYRTWADLMEYCRLSACPVGRFLLALHGEREAWEASDALCSALQVVNHVQDAKDDYRILNRVYVPSDWLEKDGAKIEDLSGNAASPGLRRTLDRMTGYTAELIARAAVLPNRLESRRLAAESAVCIKLAKHLNTALQSRDPVAHRVNLSPLNWVSAGLSGLRHLLAP